MKNSAPLIACLVVVFCGSHSRAATQPEMQLEEKVAAADSVVRARCTGVRSEWAGKRIVTRAQFAVTNDLSSSGVQRLEVTTEGGVALHPRLGIRVRSMVSEQPLIQQNDEAILFTRRARDGGTELVGGRQGYLLIRNDDRVASRVVSGQHKVIIEPEVEEQRGATPRAKRGGEALRVRSEPTPLLEYEAQVRRVFAAKPTRRGNAGSAQP